MSSEAGDTSAVATDRAAVDVETVGEGLKGDEKGELSLADTPITLLVDGLANGNGGASSGAPGAPDEAPIDDAKTGAVLAGIPAGIPAGTPDGVPDGALISPGADTAAGVPETRETEPETKSLDNKNSDSECQEIAQSLFNEQFVLVQPEEFIQFLAGNDDDSVRIRKYYMELFDWSPSLLSSTRTLCSKLYLRGESQEIDRVLLSFARSYAEQNPDNVFCTSNYETIYIILYSLVLLNTALHNAEVKKKSRMSQQEYVRNTTSTFMNQNPKHYKNLSVKQRIAIERELCKYYDDLLKNELQLKHVHEKSGPVKSNRRIVSGDLVATTATTATTHTNATGTGTGFTKLIFVVKDEISQLPDLLRQSSGSSIWSADTNRRPSLNMLRMVSGSSGVTNYSTSGSQAGSRGSRVGFTRALLSEQNLKIFQLNNNSRLSQVSSSTFNAWKTMDNTRDSAQNSLYKKASRNSVISRDSNNGVDNISMLSFDSIDIGNFTVDEGVENQQPMEEFDIADFQDQLDLTLEIQGSPYLKEGLLKLKIYNDDTQDHENEAVPSAAPPATTTSRFFLFFRGATSKTFSHNNNLGHTPLLGNKLTEHFVVVSKGELSLYSFDPKLVKKHQQRLKKANPYLDHQNEVGVGDGNWLKNAAKIGTYNLCSTFAKQEKHVPGILSSSHSTGTTYWSLTFPRTSKKPSRRIVFEAGTYEIATEYINTCNYWAAKITAIPTLEESVSSIEYGWTNLDRLIAHKDEFKKLKNIQKWEPLPKGVYLSNYEVEENENGSSVSVSMSKQFLKTLKYYNNLRKVHNDFNQLKIKFLKNFNARALSTTSNYNRMLANFENKCSDYQAELKKYKSYLVILGFALQLRFDLEDGNRLEDGDTQSGDLSGNGADSSPQDPASEVRELAIVEIQKLFASVKNIPKVIPNYNLSPLINTIVESRMATAIPFDGHHGHHSVHGGQSAFPLVKSPKTFTLSNYKNLESPVYQLSQSIAENDPHKDIIHSFSTNTIKEEEEPEETEEKNDGKTNSNNHVHIDFHHQINPENNKNPDTITIPTSV